MRIIFMGTPEFAVSSLEALLNIKQDIVAVVTSPDKPAGRGQKIQQSAVKQYASANGIPVLQPERLKNAEFLIQLASFEADLQVVVAFRMLPEQVWGMPPFGTINLHASLLPQYRGAAPINHAIINGETTTGVSTFLLQHEIDTGNILRSEKVEIGPDETAGDLHDRLMLIGARVLVETVNAVASGNITPVSQKKLAKNKILKPAPKIFKEDCLVNWHKPVADVYNLIRGLSPYPAAYTPIAGKSLKLFSVSKETTNVSEAPGTALTDRKTFLKFACPDGYIHAKEVQLAGKKRMGVDVFLRGHRL